jgi:hypothetical protein
MAYTTSGLIDPWVYFGYFLNLHQLYRWFPGTYYGARVPWVLPGYADYQVLPPVAAAYALHLGFYYGAILAYYLILKMTVGRRAALLGSVMMTGYPLFLFALGWNYPDGAGLTYFLVTLLMLTLAAKSSGRWWWLVLGGASFGAALVTQLFLITFTPLVAIFYLFACRRAGAGGIVWLGTGIVAMIVLLGVASVLLGGNFNNFGPSISVARSLVEKGNPWNDSSYAWAARASWLILPALTMLSSVTLLVFRRYSTFSDHAKANALFFQVLYVSAALTMVAWELMGQFVLQLWYYASYLIPPMFLAIGAQLSAATDRLSMRQFLLLLAVMALIVVGPFVVPMESSVWKSLARSALLSAMALNLCALGLLFARSSWLRCAGAGLLCAVVAVVAVPNGIRPGAAYGDARSPSFQRDAYLAIVKSIKAIQAIGVRENLLFWYNIDGPYGYLPRSVADTYLWGFSLASESFPKLDGRFHQPTPGSTIVILSTKQGVVSAADRTLAKIGLRAKVLAERVISEGPIVFRMTFIKACGISATTC